jgi:hypothetical protein
MSREIMQQALDALRRVGEYGDIYRHKNTEQSPYTQIYEAIDAINVELAKPEQEPVGWFLKDHLETYMESYKNIEGAIPLYTAPLRKPWVGLTSEDWENTPDTGKQGCERDAEMLDWVEQTLKDKNDTI